MVALAVILNIGMLFFFKYWNSIASLVNQATHTEKLPILDLLLPLGISFYIFQSIGYVIDVYRGQYEAEKNPFRFALFVSFFPQMVQGPISRFGSLGKQLETPQDFSFDNIKAGLQLAMWGCFKKLIVADRAAVLVESVFANYQQYDGAIILLGVIFYCLQLYCDFSGGIDITRAVARFFGIELVENFKRPIFATSLSDFWRRWHISLGSWMKDYVFYPISLSKPMVRFGKWVRSHIKGKAGKIIPVSIATFIVYFAIGIWHGASLKYIVFGFWNGAIITTSLLLEPWTNAWKAKLGITDKTSWWKAIQILRTSFLVLIGRYITRASRFLASLEMLRLTVTNFHLTNITENALVGMGLTMQDYLVIAIGTVVLLVIEAFEEKGHSLSKGLEKKNAFVQWAVMMASLLILVIFGICRGDYIASEFIYKQF